MKTVAATAMLCLLGCASAPPPLDTKIVCPPVTTWSPKDELALAMALRKVPSDSPLWTLEQDWQKMRDALKACQTPN